MTREETAKLLKLISALWSNAAVYGPDQLSAWHLVLGEDDFNVAVAAAKRIARNKPVSERGNFPPTIQEVCSEMRLLVAPWLALTYEQAQAEEHPLCRKARELVYGREKPYNPNADPNDLLQTRDIPFKEREVRRLFEELLDQQRQKAVGELRHLALEYRQDAEARASQARLEGPTGPIRRSAAMPELESERLVRWDPIELPTKTMPKGQKSAAEMEAERQRLQEQARKLIGEAA